MTSYVIYLSRKSECNPCGRLILSMTTHQIVPRDVGGLFIFFDYIVLLLKVDYGRFSFILFFFCFQNNGAETAAGATTTTKAAAEAPTVTMEATTRVVAAAAARAANRPVCTPRLRTCRAVPEPWPPRPGASRPPRPRVVENATCTSDESRRQQQQQQNRFCHVFPPKPRADRRGEAL